MTIRTDKVKRANQKLMIRKNNIETTILFLWCIILVQGSHLTQMAKRCSKGSLKTEKIGMGEVKNEKKYSC